jgi:YegS/Rv2252/BmrU family lipid kinase
MSDTTAPHAACPSGDVPRDRAVLLVNTKSRRGQEWFEDAQTELRSLGVQLDAAMSFRRIEELIAEAKLGIERKAPLIIAGGGDGTFSAIAHMFVGCGTTLGVLPLGTGNAFARDLGIPANLPEACRIVAHGQVRAIDLGVINDDYFVNVATVGLTTKIAESLTVPMKRKYGRFVYAIAITRALRHIKPFIAKIETENGTRELETMQVVIGNGRYHAGPFLLSPEAQITEGKLTLYAVKASSKAALLRFALALPSGNQGALEEVYTEETTGGTLSTFPHMKVTVDGEVCPLTPIKFGIAPGAIRVAVPTAFEK